MPIRSRQLLDRLKTTGVGLGLLRLQLDVGLIDDARCTLNILQEDAQLLLHGVDGETETPQDTRKKVFKKKQPSRCSLPFSFCFASLAQTRP
jgi:hypothetical protein